MNIQVKGFAFVMGAEEAELDWLMYPVLKGNAELTIHKFIVLRAPDSVVVVLGNNLGMKDYRHLALNMACAKMFAGYKLYGGGILHIKKSEAGITARFWGESTDYGRFDRIIAQDDVRTAIQETLGVHEVVIE